MSNHHWIVFSPQRNPPLVVSDLFEDVKDGVMLLALLEVLSGHKLPCEQGRKLRRIHWVANVGRALKFLEGRRIKLVNINTTDVVDGRPSIVLGLIWTIILYFQIEELTSHLPALQPQSSSNSSVESSNSAETSSPPVKRKPRLSFQGGAKRALLKWVQTTATKRLGLDVKDFGPSWRTGVAFHAVIFALQPHLVNMERVWRRPNRDNLEEAFSVAERELGIPRLLDPEDVDVDKPDEKSIMTYVAQFLKHHPDRQETEIRRQQEEREQRKTLRELKAWADQLERNCAQAQRDGGSLAVQYQTFKRYRVQFEVQRRQVETCIQSSQKDSKLTEDQALVKQAWERLSARFLDWHLQLDSGLPHPLGEVGVWLHQAEKILREELVPQQAHDETAKAIHKKRLHDQVNQGNLHKQTLQLIHRDRCVNNVPIPMEQLQDMAERLNYISTSSHVHLSKLEFWETKYSMLAFLTLVESKLKSWIIKYGRLESMELLLQSYGSFVEGQQFFEKYESSHQALINTAELYIKADSSVEGGVKLFLREVSDQWRSLSVEVRSVRSMLEEVQCNWLRYNSCVASLQAWLEDAQGALRQPENTKREFFRNLPHWMEQHAAMNDAGNFLIETCDETVTRDIKHQLLLLNGRWRELFLKVKKVNNSVHLSSPKLPGVEAQYKAAARSAQLLAKDSVHGSGSKALSSVTTAEAQLHQVCTMFAQYYALMQEALEWRQVAETNGNLMRRYEESRADLEKVLRVGQACLKERGEPDELFLKHNEFFGRLDQHILSAYLKACDDLTDIISEEDQQSLRETVRRLHKQWKDIQAEAPSHLLRLRVETERHLVMAMLQECQVELKREDKALLTAGSERMIKEHRAFFRQKNPLSACEKRLKTMEHLCQDLPENDMGHQTLEETRDHLSEVRGLVERTHLKLQQHPDKWREWHLHEQGNMFAVRAESLVKKAADIKLGSQNQSLLQDQAQSTKESLSDLEMLHRWWQGFSRESEAFFSWVCDSKKELEAFSRTSANLDEQIHTVEEKMDVFSRLEAEFHTLIHFVTPNEAGRIKTRLMQIGRYREEFKNSVEQREAELHSSFLNGLQEKLNVPVTSCTSASMTYKTLHEHMVSITCRDLSHLQSWLNRCESLCSSDSPYLTTDNVKLHSQLQMLQVKSEGNTLCSFFKILFCENVGLCVFNELQSHLSKLEQFSQISLALTQWSENFLRHIQSTCKVNITDLQSADSKTKDRVSLQNQGRSLEALQPHLDALSPSLASKDLQHLQTRKEDCLQLFSEAQSLVEHRDEALLKLKDFYETYNKARISLQTFQDAVEGRGSWDDSKVRDINQELGDLTKELACLEVQAISLDIILNKAHFHLQGAEEERTSCRGLVDDVALSVQVLQRSIGTKQSEAEALATMWSSFRGWKELLLGSLAKLEDRANIPWPTEASAHAFQQRLWLLKQLEEELQALQHSQLWLGERGEQLAHRDSELAGEAQRDVALVQSTWERIRAIIVEDHDLCANLLELCREYQTLKTRISSVIERAHAITVAHSDPHNPEDIRRALSRVKLAATKEDLNELIGSGKHLTGVLKKLPEGSVQSENVTTETDAIVDQWLDVSALNNVKRLKTLQFMATGKSSLCSCSFEVMAADLRKQISHAAEVYEQTRGMYKDFNSQRQQLQDLIFQISEQLKTSEDSLSEFSSSSDPENFVKIKVSEVELYLNTVVYLFLLRYETRVVELSDWLQQLEVRLKTDAPLWGESQSAAPDCSEELRRVEEIHRELLMRRYIWTVCVHVCEENVPDISDYFCVCLYLHLLVYPSRIHLSCLYLLFHRASLERLCQSSLTITERGSRSENGVAAELLTNHKVLLQEARSRLRSLQEYQAFEEALKAVETWLEDVERKLEKLENTEGNKKEVEEKLEQAQDILLMKGEGEVKLNMAAGKAELAIKSSGEVERGVICSKLQEVEDAWAALLLRAMSCHSRLEWTVNQWDLFVESRAQLQRWLEGVGLEVKGPLEPQLGLREKRKQLERLRLLSSDVEDHQGALCYLEESAAELYKRTGDPVFKEEEMVLLRAQFEDVKERVRLSEDVVLEHKKYMETIRELTDWLMVVGEELQQCSDPSGDSPTLSRKFSNSCISGRERLRRVRLSAERAGRHTAAAGCELMDGEVAALARALHQWEGASLRARDALETAVAAATGAEREHTRLTAQLEGEMEKLEGQLKEWSEGLSSAERRNSGAAAVEGWTVAKGVLEGLQTAEVMEEKLKAQLNELCGFSSDLSPQSDRVSALIKLHNSLSLRASRECQNKEKLLEQRFRSSLHDFRQWMVNANISTAKCFDSPHSIQDASIALQQIQEFKSDKEQGQTRLNAVLTYGEQLSSMVPADRMQAIRTKANAAKDDWKSLMDSLQRRETALQVLQSQMQDFEASVEPLQDWMNRTEISVQESSARLHDLPAKRLELSKLQTLLEEMRSRESELAELRGRAHGLWEGQGAGKSFVHQVCQLAACYLALSNLIKEKVSRVERVVGEHQLFSQGLQELQNWVSESQQVLKTCRCPTSDKSVLITRMGQLETLLAACQGREIQLKMLITRGESVQRNTSAEGVPVVRKQIQDLKDSWESLLSTSIQCKSQLEGALSHWTSYQEDVSQFECWMERVEESLGNSDKHYAEMRDKTANLGRAKLLYEEVLSHSSPLETIAAKGSNMTEHTATQQEIQKLSERYTAIKDKAKAAVSKAEELVLLHQEYQRGLHMFEDWLEQEQNSLALLSPLDEDVNALENTLKELQMLQSHCPKGHNLLSSVLASRERVIPWGAPQIEDRALETAQTEWQGYQDRLGETKVQVEQALARVQQLEGVFQSLDQWLVDIELKVKVRSHRRSDVTAKEAQLQHLKRWQIEAAQRQTEVEGLSTLAQQVVEDAHVSGRISTRVTQLTARYHALLLQIQDTLKQLQEEMQNITEAQNALRTFSDWLSAARKNFRIVTERTEALDRITMEKKMKRLESLQGDMDQGHSLLKTLRESAEQAVSFLDDPGASKLEREVQTGRSQLEELILGLREEHATLERSIVLYKDFQERYKSQIQWLRETRALLCSTVEPKAELYQRKAQLNKYKAVEQMLLSRDSAVSFVLEKGETLLTLLHSPSITDNMTRLQADYQELCSSARTHVHKLEAQVKKQEAYHKDLQEIERWLLQMSSRMVTPDPSSGGGLEAATQQLARHKAIMEEIAGFEERLATLKEKGEELLSGCSERLQARLRQQIQNHQQGARDSYSAICSTAQRVYQSLDRELQKRVSLRDTLQQCQTWLSNVQEEIQIPPHAPHCLQEVLAQMKQDRTLQEQASTYLQLVCSTCDLSDDKVRETAAEIQQVKLQIEERMLESQELAENWREIKDLRSNLECHLLEAEQLLQSMLRRPAELEPKVAQNQLDQAQVSDSFVDLTQLRESINRLTAGQESPELMEVGRLRCAWLDLGRQAAQLLEQKEEDLQRSGDYHDCICMVEELFDQLSKKWDQLARGDIESTAECLDALKKLSTDLQDQRCVLDDLRNNRHGILPRLSLEDRDLVKEQVGYLEQRWTQVESLVQQKIQDSAQTLEELSQIEDHLREAQEWAELQQPSLSEVLKTSPPPDLAQSFLFDHLSFCAELEAKQKLLAEAVTDANSLSSRLGLNERRKLQTLIQEAQTVVESLGTKAAQYRKSLSKVFTERTQFLQALDRAAEWIRKQEQRALADDHVALLPNVLHKQVSSCKNFTSSLRAYQVELTSLWVQGRELVKDATDEEKKETLQKLEELQVTFEASLQKSTEHLQHLEKALVIRKYFKVDLDRICEWLKQAEVATFPIIDLSGNDEELQNQLTGYQQLLDHASEYENLLLIVQRAGQEILPTLNEVDHCYLDEKLNGLPQQYNDMLLLIREKRDRIQQVLLERREFESLIDATRKALKELQEKCDGLEMKSANQSVEEGERLHSSYEDLMKDLANLFQGMKDLRVKTQDFLIMGQPYAPEVIDQLVHLHGSLNQQIECKMKELRKTLKILNDHRAVIEKMDCGITRFKEQLGKFDSKGEEEADAMERLSTLHNLSKCFEEVSSYPEGLKAQNDDLIQHFDSKTLKTQVIFREEQLLTLKQKMNAHIEECERGFRGNKDFQTDIKVSIDWLKSLKDRLRYPLMFEEAKIELVQKEVRSLSALQEQMKSRFRLLEYMTDAEKQKYINDQKPFPKLFETTLMDIPKLSITQWRSFQDETEEVIRQMNEVEKRMTEFKTAKANSEEEAEDKFDFLQCFHHCICTTLNIFFSAIFFFFSLLIQSLFEELDECGRALSELNVAVQEFGEQNPLLAKQLGSSLSKLTELHVQTTRLAEERTTSLQKAEKNFEEFNEMLTLTLNWTEKAETVVSAHIMWSPASQMQEQIRTHQALLQEWQDLQGEFEGLVERVGLLGEVVQTDALHQQVAELSRHAEELQQRAKTRLLMLQDAAKDLGRLESDVKSLHQSIERVQETLASPDLARLSLREQLAQRQLLLSEMEGLKQQVQDMQMCQSTLRLPEDVIAALPLCVTAQSLQQESSQLQHNTIQQCNILQEAMVQYEQYEQEVKNLQRLIEEAHRVIQDRPVATGNIQELQTQIQHHEELALKIKGYQEQISALNSKCKMLTVKAKHATMLLTVSEVDGLSDGLEELEDEEEEMPKHPPAHPSVVMMTAGRCHTLLSPVTEESGEEGTNSEVSSPPACRSPSPGPNADTSQVPRASNPNLASSSPLQELYDPSMESAASANLDDLQRSWETLKNVISEKQKSLYEALERQQHYQETLQSVSTKMESIETALNEGLEPSKSPESQMAAHQALMDEILMLKDEISALQACFSQELQLDEDSLEADAGDQLALQSTLTVLGERMATIHMKASGKRQLLEERLSEQLEEQRQEQALQRYHSEAEELDNWLLSTRATLSSTLQPHPQDMDMEEQLIDCQNMLLEIEQKVLCLSELSVHSESLLMEGKAGTRGDAEQLSLKLHSLKSSLLELQRILQDKQTHIQGSLQEQEDIESDSSLSQSPNMMDWLSQARSTRNQQHQDTVQRQRSFIYVLPQTSGADIKRAHALKRALYEAVSTTSSWLDNAENELVSGPILLSDDSETHLGHLELWDGESGESVVVEEVLDGLEGRLKLLDTVLEQRCDTMKDKLQELTVFQAELRLLLASLSDSKYQLLQKMNAIVAEAEDSLREFEQKVSEMRSRGETLQPNQLCTQELLKLQDAYEELVEMVGSKRSGLNQNLVDLLDTAQDKMTADQKMKVGSVIEVQILLDKHKEYFQGLETHVVLTQAFFRQVSGLVVQREVQSLEETVAQAQAVLKQAHKRGVELEGILEWWSRLVGDYQALYRQLEAVESNIPSVGLVEETEDRLSDRIALYQRLKASLSERQQQLYKLLEDGKRLLLHVSCSELETQLTQLGDHWLSTTTKINKELHRLDSTLKHWIRYQCESAELSQWLSSALDRLEFWSTQSVTVPQELETVRDHLHAFLEFSKEVDAKSSLRASVQSQGNQLLRLKKVDTAALRANLAQVDTQWADLLARIPVVQEKLHQLQMEKLPSRHAITELMSWISLMENIIQEDQQKIMGAVGSEAVQMYLQKYKGFQIDLSCKQLTVDFVNQSVLQISSQDVEGKRSDKTDFAERLGAMNRRWQILQGLVTEKIQVLEGLLERCLEYENVVQTLKTWFSVQEEKLKKKHRIEDVSSAQNALKDCQEMEVLVKEKEKDMEKAEEKGCLLIQDKKGEAGTVIMDTLKGLNQSWANLDHMIGQQTVSLRSVLEQWSLYKQAYEEIQGYLMEGRYTISRLRLLTGSPEAVQVQVENLESLQDELEKQESSLRKLGSITQQLLTDCHPSVSDSLNSALADVNLRWNTLLEQISDQLRRSKSLLQLWQHYKALHAQSSTDIQKLEDQVEQLLKSATHRDVTEQEVKVWIYQYMVCLCAWIMLVTQKYSVLQQLDEFSEQLRQQVDPSAMTTFHTDHLSLTQRLATVGHTLQRQQSLLEVGMRDYERFSKELHSLSHWSEEAERVLKEPDQIGSPDISSVQEHMEKLKTQMLKLSSLSPDLERLNELGYQLPLNDNEIKRLQNLNRSWSSNSARTIERFSKLQALVLQRQTFLEKCDAWMTFLTQTEEKLATEISGNYQSLLDQQREHELFQAEMFSRQQILYSIINDGHQLLNQGQVEDRDEFGLKLALLSNQWQGVVRRAQQRRGIIDSLVRQWQRYTELIEKLRHWLQEVSMEPEEQQQVSTVALQQIRGMLDHIQLKERVLQRQQGSYILTVEAGRQLLLWADTRTEASLHTELTDVQERWRTINIRLDERKKELLSLLRDWDQCEKGIAASHEKLRDFKQKLSAPLPDHHEELHTEQIRCKELESSIEGWADDVAGLCILRESLSSGLSADNLTVLQERLILLQRQWEETCHQLSLRRQQVSERLNEWAVFNEKNKELCEWLTQMESKVSQNGDISIGEMIEKLRKDYQEEISVAKENKHQLEQMGERLAQASHESKAAEIQYKLSKVNERWQHLLDLIEARVKKLRETLVAVQQLDKNMSSLRSWLAHIETELSRPIVYETCDSHEIQRKLKQQQDLQHDIEKHSTGVASVLNLCEVLLHDCDACATETECESIQQATRGLDRRWRNICAIAMERRLKIEETWRLWQKFLDDYSRFEEWLKVSERTAALPNSSGVLYTIAKEELKKFEVLRDPQRGLIRLNFTKSLHQHKPSFGIKIVLSGFTKDHFIGQREEFETARDGVLVWLTEMDLQLTNIEHFSECDVQAKIKQLKAFQQEISLNMGKMESVFGQGEVLMEKCEPLDAAVIEEELDELQRYCREVFGRVERYYQKLTRLPLTDDEGEGSDREFESGDLSDLQWGEDGTMSQTSSRPPSAGTAPVRTNDSGRDTPASEDSIPLEWDHDYDLDPMGHTMSAQQGRQKDEDEELLCLATAALTGESVRLLDNMMDTSCYSLQETDGTMGGHDTSYMGYMRLMDDCRGSLKAVRRVEGELEEEEDNLSGLSNPDNTETQSTGVIERWELIQAQSADSDHKEREDLVLLQKMTSDLDAMEAWLSQAEAELEELRGKNLSADIHTIEQRIRKLKELQKAMDSHKSKVLSINLNSVTLLQSVSEESQDLQAKLKEMNSRWDRLGKSLKDWRTALQDALMQCQEFHELSHGLLLWLENIDRRRNEIIPIASGLDRHTLQAHYRALKQIQRELLESEQKVDSLQELSGQLLVQAHGSECLEAQERVHVIGNRLRLLLKAVAADLELLEKELQASGNRQDASLWSVTDDADTSGSLSPVSGVSISTKRQSLRGKCSVLPSGSGCVSSRSGSSGSQGGAAVARCQPFLLRVLRAALPLQLLLLLIVGLTCLVPMTEQDYSCAHANNFARSFHPMLHYTNGPPPV
uniref:Spectrin repeat containing, nuclear envelope 1a n=1 Tax=Cyprinus carpio TaxID=7962 RepID=A0A8C2DGG1_CYPCA